MFVIRRSSHNPILTPIVDREWESRGTFNGCPVKIGDVTHMVYRALSRPDVLRLPGGLSTIGKAISLDGENFHNRRQFIAPQESWEEYGCEDPRVTFFEGKYYVFYTALGGVPFGPGNIKCAVAVSKDMESLEERHLITPFNAKAMTLFPERINGKITVMFSAHTDMPPTPTRIAVAQFDRIEQLWDLSFWESWYANFNEHTINPLRFDHDHVEVGAPPLKVPEGWLVFYSYFQDYYSGEDKRVCGIEAILLANDDPFKIVGRTRGPLLVPETIYELYGIMPNCIFPSGALLEKNRVDIYYGGADTVCAKASLNLPDLLAAIIPERREELVIRAKENPILSPIPENAWESVAVFNAAAFEIEDTVHILYRAMGADNTSVLGYAATKNGIKITERDPQPAYVPRADFEMKKGSPDGNSGCEDPRVTVINDRIYMTYTAYDGVASTRVALTSISVTDFLAKKWGAWAMPMLTTPDGVNDKDMCLLPEKISGNYMFMHRIDPMICADFQETLNFDKTRLSRCIELMGPRPGVWDSKKIGIAGPPIKTEKGWLLIYHGVSKTGTYRLGAALLDYKNPSVVLSRSVDTIFEPVAEYEVRGLIPRAVFSCGAVIRKDSLFIYYGGADTVLGVAKVSVKKLLKILLPDNLV